MGDIVRIVMLLSNAFRPDPRVAREAKTLVQAGYEVTLVCWDREARHAPHESVHGYRVERVQDVRTVYGAGLRQALYTPRFWRAAARIVHDLSPHVIHCHDLDTLPAGWWLKRRMHACLVYDAHEDYPAMMSLYLPQPAVAVLAWLESRLLRRTDHIITASSVLADKLRGRTAAPVTTLGNYQPLAPYDAVRPSDVATARSELGIPRDGLLVAYIGGFSRNRMLAPLLDAAQELSDVTVLIWGDGHQRPLVEARADQISNVRYLGWLPAAQVPLYMQVADVIYYCLLPDYPGAIYNAPNTLSQAMAAGRPIIANEVGDLGRIVGQTGCGLLVPEVTAAAIREAISTLRNPVLRQTLGQAGRAAAASHYNWEVAGQQLQGVYAGLLNEV